MSASAALSFDSSAGLITGAAGQLGSSVARALVDAGARLTLADLPGEALDRLRKEFGDRAHVVELDVLDEERVAETMKEAQQFGGGRMDFVFSNAGVEGPVGPLTDLDVGSLTRTLAVNVVGPAIVLKYALRLLEPGGRVVQTGSTASTTGAPNLAPYVASKHALLGLTRVASREVADRGIRVTCLMPGPIDGPMMTRIEAGRAAAETPTGPAASTVLDGGRRAQVDEIVQAALFLLGEESSFVAGVGLMVDGGRSA